MVKYFSTVSLEQEYNATLELIKNSNDSNEIQFLRNRLRNLIDEIRDFKQIQKYFN